MSRHWRPSGKIVRIRPMRGKRLRALEEFDGPWTSLESYAPPTRRSRRGWIAGALLVGAVCVGVGYGYWTGTSPQGVDSSAIHWNEVQAVPTRVPDAADIEWQKRGEAPLPPPVEQAAQAAQAGLPRVSSARNDGIYVIDGDTFSYAGQRIRIAGIDAPETHPPRCMAEARLGLAATEKLRQLLGSGTVTISGSGHDQYGRELSEVRVNGQDVGEAMISAGLARSYNGEKRQGWC